MSLPLIGAADCGADAPRSHWGNKLVPAAVLLVGIVRSGIASQSPREETSRDAQTRLDTVTANAAVQVERRFAAYFEVLAGLRALFHTVDNVSRQDFHRYAQALSLKRAFPGFQVLNYAPHVLAGCGEPLRTRCATIAPCPVALASRSLRPGARDGYLPFTLIEPLAENQQYLGKDIAASPASGTALVNGVHRVRAKTESL